MARRLEKEGGFASSKRCRQPISLPESRVGRNLLRTWTQLPDSYAVGIGSVLLSRNNKPGRFRCRKRRGHEKRC